MKDKYLKSEKRIVKNIPLFYIVCAGIVLLCAGITLGMLFARNDDEPSVDTGKIGEQCVLPYTLVRVVKNYTCGHTEIYESDEYTGYTKSMLKSLKNCRIDTMTDEYVCLVFDLDECCSKHYLLMLVEEDVVCVFSTNESEGGNVQLMEIALDSSKIDEEEHGKLIDGIIFDSLEEINAYIENIET